MCMAVVCQTKAVKSLKIKVSPKIPLLSQTKSTRTLKRVILRLLIAILKIFSSWPKIDVNIK